MMTWIKNHPGQAAVIALSVTLAASSVELYRDATASIPRGAEKVRAPEISSESVASQPMLDRALTAARGPGRWETRAGQGRLFASKDYVLYGRTLQTPVGKMFHPPVPNDWLIQHGLNPTDSDVLTADPDKDGFSTLLEWEGMDATSHLDEQSKPVPSGTGQLPSDWTSPVDAGSHPPYHTRLVLQRVEQIPFHLRFLGYDENPKNPKDVTVQINAMPGRTEFIEVGKALKYAPFDVQSFAKEMAPGPDGTERDMSSIIVIDRRTQQQVKLVKGELANSPESYAILFYTWTDPRASGAKSPTEIRVKNGHTFQLLPEGKTYKVAAIEKDRVDILLPTGETYSVHARAARK